MEARQVAAAPEPAACPRSLAASIAAAIPRLEGWCTPQKGEYIARCVLECDAATIVELGVFGGRSAIAMALACRHKGSGRVHAVDPWATDECLVGTHHAQDREWWGKVDLEEIYRGFLARMLELDLTRELLPLRMSSASAARLFGDDEVDVLHQDSNHSQEVSSAEVALWWPKVRHGGWWLFDDVDWPTTANAYRALLDLGADVRFNDGRWAALRKP